MVEVLGEDLDFWIVTSDRDYGDHEPYRNVAIDDWNVVGRAKVYYASPGSLSLKTLAAVVREIPHDVLYVNSFFDPVFAIRPLLARYVGLLPPRPTVIAPRGELAEGALALKRWKKEAYRVLARISGLHRHMIWQASSQYEAEEIRRSIGPQAQRVVVAPDLPPRPRSVSVGEEWSQRAPGDPLRICFLSRISRKKNLDYALRVLRRVPCPVVFDIYGPFEDPAYWAECQALAKEAGEFVTVRYQGSVEYDDVPGVFRRHDLFLFPTRNENYGHVVIESLLAGTPVLLSDGTPWRGLEALGVGWDLPLADPDAFVSAIAKAASLDAAGYARWRERVRGYALERCDPTEVVEANRRLFLDAVEAK